MSTSLSGLVSFSWPSRGGYGYRVETSPDLASGTWQPLATFFGNGNALSIPVARIAPPGQQGGQNPPPGPTNTLKSAHFTLRTFPGLNQTLVAWNQPEQTGLSQVLVAADFSHIVNLPLFFGKFTDAPNATDYHLSFMILGGTFDSSFNTLPALNVDETERLGWFTERLGEVKLAMEDAQLNGRSTNGVPATGAGVGGPGVRLFYRVVEMYQDADNDGILDHHEWGVTGGDPWLVDSDFDGYTDAEEFAAGSDPNDPNSTPTNTTNGPPGSDLPADEDEDGDTIPNALDADPLDINVDWERRPFPEFAVLPIPQGGNLDLAAVNNRGEVVANTKNEGCGQYWRPGMEEPVALKIDAAPIILSVFSEMENDVPVLEEVTYTLAYATARDINDAGVIVGEGVYAAPGQTPPPGGGSTSTSYAPGPILLVALQWSDWEAEPAPIHPGSVPAGEWGDFPLHSSARHLNEDGTILGEADFLIPSTILNATPPFSGQRIPTLWSSEGGGPEGQPLYEPGGPLPSLAPVLNGLAREDSFFTGSAGAAAYWEDWDKVPTHPFPAAGSKTVRISHLPNGRQGIAGDRRLMLLTEDGRWEPALRTYRGGFALTEDGTVWFTDNGQSSLWHPLEKTTLTAITDGEDHDIQRVADVTNTGVAAIETAIGNLVLLPVEIVEGNLGTADESLGSWLMTAANPTPRIETKILEAEIVGTDLHVSLRGTVRDSLSAYGRSEEDRVREVSLELFGKPLGTIPLEGDAGHEATFTDEITIPNVRAGSYLLRARTEANAAGNVGWDDVAIGVTRDWATPDGFPEASTFRIAFGSPPTAATVDTATIYFGDRTPLPSDGTATESDPGTLVFVGSATYGQGNLPCILTMRGPSTFSPSNTDTVDARISLTLPTGTAVLAASLTETAPGSLVFFLPQGTPTAFTGGLAVATTVELEGSTGEFEAKPFTVRMPSSPEFPAGTIMRVSGTDYPVKEFTFSGRTALYPYDPSDSSQPKLFLPCVAPVPDYLRIPGTTGNGGTQSLNFELIPGGETPGEPIDLISLQVQPGSPPADPYASPYSAGTGSVSAQGAGNSAAARWKKPGDTVTMEDLLDAFKFQYGDAGQRLLGYFEDADGIIQLGNVSGDLDIDFFTTDSHIYIQIEKNDTNVAGSLYHPGIAAHLLWQGLNECLVYGSVQAQIPAHEWQLYQQGREQFGQFACGVGVGAAQIYLAGISIALEPVDWVLTLNELSEGNYTALAGALPFIPAGIFSGTRGLLLRGPGGEVLDRIGSAEQLAELQDLYRISDANERLRVMGVIVERDQFNDTIRNILAAGNGPIARYTKDSQRKLLEKRMREVRPMPEWGKRTVVCKDGKTRGYRTIQAHHDFPWEHHDFFTKHGLDPNDPAFGRWVGDYDHYRWHHDTDVKFNDFWDEFIDLENEIIAGGGAAYSKQQILDKLAEARDRYRVTNGN